MIVSENRAVSIRNAYLPQPPSTEAQDYIGTGTFCNAMRGLTVVAIPANRSCPDFARQTANRPGRFNRPGRGTTKLGHHQ